MLRVEIALAIILNISVTANIRMLTKMQLACHFSAKPKLQCIF